MSSIKPEEQSAISSITINMSKEIMVHKLKFCCRLCMDERRTKVSLFEVTSRRIQLTNAEILQVFTDILAGPEDGLPQMICTKCENMLHLILDFKFECQDSNEALISIYETLNPKVETEENATEMLDEQELYESNMSVEVLEPEFEDRDGDGEEGEIKPVVCKTESVGEFEVVVEGQDNEELPFETDEKEDLILIQVVDDDEYPNIQTEMEVSDQASKTKRNKNSKCPECGKMVEGPAKLTRHMRVHERESKKALTPLKPPKEEPSPHLTVYSCDVCKKEFNLASRLKKHLETHLPMSMRQKSFVCHCGKQYLDSGALRTHGLIAHSDNVPLFACEICNKEFTRKNYRDYHQRLHTSNKPHACTMCEFRSAKRHNLIRHMLVHSNEFNFQCDACGKKFKRKTGLDSHQRTHCK